MSTVIETSATSSSDAGETMSASPNPAALRPSFGFWLDERVPASTPIFLYFEARGPSESQRGGVLEIWGTTPFCILDERLARIALTDLALSTSWETRCVELIPSVEYGVLGLQVVGTNVVFDVDTFRFGPPC